MASDSTPCHLHAIKTVWASVEPYLDLQSTIRASRACRALHAEIVDADTQKIKVSRFSAVSGPWDRVPYYLPSALNAIHFPSLLDIHLPFPALISPGEGVDEDVSDSVPSCFPIFVTHLASARNLERLYLNLSEVLIDDSLSFVPLLRILGRNLARCKKLTSLDLLCADQEEYCTLMATEMLLALTPVLRQQKDVLRCFGLNFMTSPTTPSELSSSATDFFGAILSCTNLERLDIELQHSPALTNGLLKAAKENCSSKNYSPLGHCLKLHHLGLSLDLGMSRHPSRVGRDQTEYLKSAHLLFDHFSHCEQLQRVHLHLPVDIWADRIDTIASMLSGRPKLTTFSFLFCGYADDDGRAMNLLENCLVKKYTKVGLEVQELRKVDGQRLFQMMERSRAVDLEGFASVDSEEGAEGDGAGEAERHVVDHDTLEEDIPEKVDIVSLWLAKKSRET